MNSFYGYRLFTSVDFKKAFNYLFHDTESEYISKQDRGLFDLYDNDTWRSYMLIRANMKKVQNICNNKIIPLLGYILDNLGQDHGFIIFNPTIISSSFNPFVISPNDIMTKVMNFIMNEMFNMPAIWIQFPKFSSTELQQIINLKYKKLVDITEDGSTYLQLLPQEDFSLIYDFINDICRYC